MSPTIHDYFGEMVNLLQSLKDDNPERDFIIQQYSIKIYMLGFLDGMDHGKKLK